MMGRMTSTLHGLLSPTMLGNIMTAWILLSFSYADPVRSKKRTSLSTRSEALQIETRFYQSKNLIQDKPSYG